MKPKYKIGDRVVYETLNKEGDPVERMGWVYSIQINLRYENNESWITYKDLEDNEFDESDILHKLAIIKPRKSKANKIVQEMKEFKAPKPPESLADLIVDALEQDKQI